MAEQVHGAHPPRRDACAQTPHTPPTTIALLPPRGQRPDQQGTAPCPSSALAKGCRREQR
eukprot:12908270-Alexandrium_andersonii.AAC.1